MIVEDGVVEQRVHGAASQRFQKTVLRLPGDPPRFVVRKRLPGGASRATPVLLLHGFGQNRRAWHQAERSFANHLAAAGFDVFNTELRGHGRSRRAGASPSHGLEHAVDEDVPAALALASSLTGAPRAFVLGHSLGGLIAYAVAAGSPDRVAGVVTLGAPLDFGRGSATLSLLRAGISRVRAAPHRAFPMAQVRAGLRRTAAAWDLPWLPVPLRAWAPGSMEPGLRDSYLGTAFDAGSFGQLRAVFDAGETISARWSRCDVPALILAGSFDLLAPPASVRPAHDRHLGSDRTYAELPFGHGDLLLGREAPARVWSLVTRWLTARDGLG
ncbi:MAG: alpha/beta hydrolase [Polyangiales bacterium]